jgi:hypothetical protein
MNLVIQVRVVKHEKYVYPERLAQEETSNVQHFSREICKLRNIKATPLRNSGTYRIEQELYLGA